MRRTMLDSKNYVWQGDEIRLTGREAIKKTTSGKEHKLVEIESADRNTPGPKWTKWVRMTDLFEIVPTTKPTPPRGIIKREGEL